METNDMLHAEDRPEQVPAQPAAPKGPARKHKWWLGLIALVLVAGLAFAGGFRAASTGKAAIYAAAALPEATKAPDTASAAGGVTAAAPEAAASASPEAAVTPVPAYRAQADVRATALSAQEVAAKTVPSVVAITTEQMTTDHYWFGAQVSGGAGSGVVLSADGYIVTNSHVISGADTITVELHDGTTYPATVQGVYYDSDLAVIKIDATGLTPVEFGSSAAVVQGDTVYAVGNPEGTLSSSISKGIVSALERTIQVALDIPADTADQSGQARQSDGAQTPAPTAAPEQSGNAQGSDSYNFGGLGDLFSHFFGGGSGNYGGSSYRGYDGYVNFEESRSNRRIVTLHVVQFDAAVSPGNSGGGLFNEAGQLVGIVCAKSSDYNAEGLSFAIEGDRVNRIAASLMTTGAYTPTEEERKEAEAVNAPAATTNKAVLGITVTALDTAAAQEYGYTSAGVYVIEISADSTKKAGLAVGDRIISVDDVVVSATADITDYLADKAPGDSVTLSVERGGKLQTFPVTLIENTAAEN